MNMLLHNLKVAFRNLLKYKVQTLMSILSLAIGMVTLAVVHSLMLNFRPSSICHEPYYDRAYTITFDSLQTRQTGDKVRLSGDIVRALKSNGGLRGIEQGPYAPNGYTLNGWAEFTLEYGVRRKLQMKVTPTDCHYLNFSGIRSAITGDKIKVLKRNEAVISIMDAKKIFGNQNPVGAKLNLRRDGKSYHLTVVDVFQDLSKSERILHSGNLFYSPETLENMDFDNDYYAIWLDVVLKENASREQVETEANARLKPLGLKAKVTSLQEQMSYENTTVQVAMAVSYLIGSLVLIAAIIGFLRMQTQLFWMRRREISLRITNGSTRGQLFGMFATENVCIVLTACIIAIMMCEWVSNFIADNLTEIADDLGSMSHLYQYSLAIGLLTLLLCLAVVWLSINRICNSQSLEMKMRKSHSHWFRNMMLGVQVAISIFFMSGTFDFMQLAGKIAEYHQIPQDESLYEQSLYMQTEEADDSKRLKEQLTRLAELEKFIPYETGFYRFDELSENESLIKALDENIYGIRFWTPMNFYTHLTSDVALLDFFQVEVNWKQKVNRTRCVLVNEKMYQKMRQTNVASNGMLTFRDETYPIAGTYKSMAYQPRDWNRDYSVIVIDPKMKEVCDQYILVPKKGEYTNLQTAVQKVIHQLEPAVVKPMMLNLRSWLSRDMRVVETLRGTAGILASISFAICLMSIFSTAMLDARTRRKEIAIRKVNGALGRDIAKVFGKAYAVITGVAMIFAIVVALLFHILLSTIAAEMHLEISPVIPILLGVLLVILFIAVIIAWQIRSIMRIDPSEILAKE